MAVRFVCFCHCHRAIVRTIHHPRLGRQFQSGRHRLHALLGNGLRELYRFRRCRHQYLPHGQRSCGRDHQLFFREMLRRGGKRKQLLGRGRVRGARKDQPPAGRKGGQPRFFGRRAAQSRPPANPAASVFLAVAGGYHGLFSVPNQAAAESPGAIAVTITRAGAFSARLDLAGWSDSFSGKFSEAGTALVSIPRLGRSTVTVQLQLGPSSGTLTGTVSDGVWTAALLADAVVNATAFRAPSARRYTLLIPGSENGSGQPGGNGSRSRDCERIGRCCHLAGNVGRRNTRHLHRCRVPAGAVAVLYFTLWRQRRRAGLAHYHQRRRHQRPNGLVQTGPGDGRNSIPAASRKPRRIRRIALPLHERFSGSGFRRGPAFLEQWKSGARPHLPCRPGIRCAGCGPERGRAVHSNSIGHVPRQRGQCGDGPSGSPSRALFCRSKIMARDSSSGKTKAGACFLRRHHSRHSSDTMFRGLRPCRPADGRSKNSRPQREMSRQ